MTDSANGLTAIIAPTHKCNLYCRYCYLPPTAEAGRMSLDSARNAMREVARCSGNGSAQYIWHGGEPLIMGLDFFKGIKQISNDLREKGFQVRNSVQTNATLLSDEFVDFFSEQQDFSIGISLDGPREVNDKTRCYPDGSGTFDCISAALDRISSKNGNSTEESEFSISGLVVLSKANIEDIENIFSFFQKRRIGMKLNPLFESGRALKNLVITPAEYFKALAEIFEIWIAEPNPISVEPLEEMMGNLLEGRPRGCRFFPNCTEFMISIGPEGDVYPCSRFCGIYSYRMGNLRDEGGLSAALSSKIKKRISLRSTNDMEGCRSCDYKNICNAGCMHNAFLEGDIFGRDPFCFAYRALYMRMDQFLHLQLKTAEAKHEKQ